MLGLSFQIIAISLNIANFTFTSETRLTSRQVAMGIFLKIFNGKLMKPT